MIKIDLLKLSENYYDQMLCLLHDICVIPAPSGYEDERAEFILKYLKDLGVENARIDEAKNVVCTLGEETDDIVLFMAHTDTVFPMETPLNYIDDGEKIYCPGVIDDVACVVIMLAGIKYMVENKITPKRTLMFVANACEEGLGRNLREASMPKYFDLPQGRVALIACTTSFAPEHLAANNPVFFPADPVLMA